jgi:hypothetical protein
VNSFYFFLLLLFFFPPLYIYIHIVSRCFCRSGLWVFVVGWGKDGRFKKRGKDCGVLN